MSEVHYNVAEAAEYLGLGERTVSRKINETNEIQASRYARNRVLIAKSELDRFRAVHSTSQPCSSSTLQRIGDILNLTILTGESNYSYKRRLVQRIEKVKVEA